MIRRPPRSPLDRSSAAADVYKRQMEDSLYARPGVDRKGAQALLDVYLAYAKLHPLDSMTPEYIFRGASIKSTLGDPQSGIALYDLTIRNFKHWPHTETPYYLKTFNLDNVLDQDV